ncbi:peptidoglycan-binding domain-containing protein [Cellulomonas palmilytica]|uniref:peptidoglycan-binding domain-containing protein n=1 Tax=Cellulomonas palmilytica TaxID=2608402 RepID=UPI001F159A21|nr:peptidoglycan-binding domain-containing protein [Cellulomonas palmilytica]UJP40741.1 peptidoglycan-binding protein [Cellulomonas palmilytica]
MAVVVAFVVGSQVRSPWEVAVANSHSSPLVTATVEERTLVVAGQDVTGTVTLGRTQDVPAPDGEGVRAVVTATPVAAGDPVAPGAVLVEVSGRPVIGWELPFPMYRDLRGGAEGPDVRAVQQALLDAGHYSGSVDGEYGPATALAVEALYRAAGAEPHEIPAEAVAAARAADQAVADARDAVSSGREGDDLDEGATGGRGAQEALADARQAAADAHTAALTPLPAAETFDLDGADVTLVRVSRVGTVVEPGGPVAQVRSGAASVTARVGVAAADAYTVGAAVSVSAQVGDATVAATVTAVGAFVAEATQDGAPPGYDVTIELPEDAGFEDGTGVVVQAADGDEAAGLAVPLVAVREDSSGTFVLRLPPGLEDPREQDADRVRVTVTTTADGYALVEDTDLTVGDVVVVATSP